jgi:RNA polymerase sigma-70 factor, ECF subfamily
MNPGGVKIWVGPRVSSGMPEKDGDALLESSTGTRELISRFQAGDERSLERLWARYLPRLKKWAHGRLPSHGHNAADTDDLIQDSFVRSLAHLRTLKPRGPQSLMSYFKVMILNQIRDYVRQSLRRPVSEIDEAVEQKVGGAPSPLEQLLGREVLERYQSALMRLSEDDQLMVLAVVELTMTDTEIAELFEKPSIDAARMARGRALARLARAMQAAMSGSHDRP